MLTRRPRLNHFLAAIRPTDVKPAVQPAAGPSTRGRGTGLRGRGRGRGGAAAQARSGPKQDDMIASGPFAMGPAQGEQISTVAEDIR